MRILHLTQFLPPHDGDIPRFVADLSAAQARRKHDVATVAAHSDPAAEESEDEIAGVEVHRSPCKGAMLTVPRSPRYVGLAKRVIGEFKPDIIAAHMPNAWLGPVSQLPVARGIPWVVHWHADPGGRGITGGLGALAWKPAEGAVLTRAARMIVSSRSYVAASKVLRGGKHQAKAVVVPLGLDPARLAKPSDKAARAAKLAWAAGHLRMLCVGRLTPYKGHDVLVRALAEAPGASCAFVGRGDQESSLRKLIDACDVGDRVRLVTDADDDLVAALFQEAAVVALPSLDRSEAFGVVLLEAMAAGKPALATWIEGSGVPEVAKDGVNAVLVKPGDVSELAAAIHRVSSDPASLRRLGEAGKQRFDAEYHIDLVTRKVNAVYHNVLQAGSGGH